MNALHRELSRSAAFESMPEDVVAALAATMTEQRVAAGERLLCAGARGGRAQGLYLVLDGRFAVRLPRPGGGQLEVRIIEAGELIGVLGLLKRRARRAADVVALTDAHVAHLPPGSFQALAEGDDELSVAFLQAIGRQLARDLRRVDTMLQESLLEAASEDAG
jgi:CRP-like cAMP-binding protein